ncbi:MAG: hypothetical protein VX498_11015 [Myxococcota bacterium]|nr:hypothetical protein [Myxococcota bacterium]
MAETPTEHQLILPLSGADSLPGDETSDLPEVRPEDLERLHRVLAGELGEPIDLVGTRNRQSMLSWERDPSGILKIRLQRQFALADSKITASLARWIRTEDVQAREIITEYAAGFQAKMAPPKPRFAHPAGTHHDLRDHLDEQNRACFDGAFKGRIGWSRMNRGRVRRRIRLGSWSERHRLIRIHPVLDSAEVPHFVIGFIVFHEMLHAIVGAEEIAGRRRAHNARFREIEQAHPSHDRAEAWIEEMTETLLCY